MVVSKVAEGKGNFGYDALKDEYTDLVKAGIIDPTKVTRSALQNAASVSTLLLTSDALIADMPKDERSPPAAAATAATTTCIETNPARRQRLWSDEGGPGISRHPPFRVRGRSLIGHPRREVVDQATNSIRLAPP